MSSPTRMHTLIRNCGVLWIDDLQRWAAARELLRAQGFPIGSTQFKHVSSFDVNRITATIVLPGKFVAERSILSMRMQAGSSQHLNCVGLINVYVAAFVRCEDFRSLALLGLMKRILRARGVSKKYTHAFMNTWCWQ